MKLLRGLCMVTQIMSNIDCWGDCPRCPFPFGRYGFNIMCSASGYGLAHPAGNFVWTLIRHAALSQKQLRDLGMGSPFVSSGIGALDSLGFMSRSAKRSEQVWEILHVSPGLPLPRGQSFAHITIGLAGPVICNLSPTMSCQWASVSSRLLCSSDLVPVLCPLSRAVLPGQPFRATFASAPFAVHKLWAMSSIVCLITLISVTSGPNFLACSKLLRGACVCSCGTRTRSPSAIFSLPCCKRLIHEHNPVLINQAG